MDPISVAPARHQVSQGCKGCGACVEVCPAAALEIVEKRAVTNERRAQRCVRCGGCVAVCPNGALALEGMGAELFPALAPCGFDAAQLQAFLDARRSVRVFKDKPVEREVLEQVLRATAAAPMGFPPHTTEVRVLQSKEEREHLAQALRQGYEELLAACKNPIGRRIVRFSAGAEEFHTLQVHLLSVVQDKNERHRERGEELYLYGAPVVLLFCANRWSIAYRSNAYIAATYAMLAAHAAGLGATMLDIVAPMVNRSKELKARYQLAKDDRVLLALILGYPKYKYARAVKRELKAVHWR